MRAGALTFSRADDGRVLTGITAGFPRQHGVDPWVVRGSLIVLTFAGGLGLVLYALGAVVAEPDAGHLPDRHAPDPRRNLAVALVTLGLLLVVRSTGLWLGDTIMIPLVVVVAGAVVLALVRADEDGPVSSAQIADAVSGRHTRTRLLLGSGLVALGLIIVGLADNVSGTVRIGVFASALSVIGVAILVGPSVARSIQSATEERRQRIRAQEREAMAAHLHDSVLQTLALIQRTADDPRRTASLARQQEHELRAWLYGTEAQPTSLTTALGSIAREVEQRYDVRIEVVVVGDAPIDDSVAALCAAVREACVNAAKHSGDSQIALYAEVSDESVDAYVRDRGKGFDRSAAGGDRRGIAGSIEGRIAAVGGVAVVESSPGEGTEVRVTVPRAINADGPVTS